MIDNKILKVLALNIGIGLTYMMLFSPGILGVEIIGESAFSTAASVTSIFMGAVVFAYGNYKLLLEEKIIQSGDIKSTEDYINALKQNYNKKIFEKDISAVLEQIVMFQKKRQTIREVLRQKFDAAEMSYSRFDTGISDLEAVFYLNIKGIINKLNSFDEKDYMRIRKDEKTFSEEFVQTKIRIYDEYISSIKKAIEDNEQIILKLDKILLELTKLNSIAEIEDMSAMREIDDLISKIKLYN